MHVRLRELQSTETLHILVFGDLLDHHFTFVGDPHCCVHFPGKSLGALFEQLLCVVRRVVCIVWGIECRPLYDLFVVCRRNRMFQIRSAGRMHPTPSHGSGKDVHVFLFVQHRIGLVVRIAGCPVFRTGLFGLRTQFDHQSDFQRPDRESQFFWILVYEQDFHLYIPFLYRIDLLLFTMQTQRFRSVGSGTPRSIAIATGIERERERILLKKKKMKTRKQPPY